MATTPELEPGQQAAVDELNRVLGEFALALQRCGECGVKPVDAFRACGVDVPGWAAPMVNSLLPH